MTEINFDHTVDRLGVGFFAVAGGSLPAAVLAGLIHPGIMPVWLIGGAVGVLIWAAFSPDQPGRGPRS